MKIVVHGIPAPQGSKKVVGRDKTGRAILAESSSKVRPWRTDVRLAALDARGDAEPLDCPLIARMVFTLAKPASAPKTKRTYAKSAPDLSKLVRSTEDALQEAGLITNDSRIVEYSRLAKVFPGEDPESLRAPGVVIELRPMEATLL